MPSPSVDTTQRTTGGPPIIGAGDGTQQIDQSGGRRRLQLNDRDGQDATVQGGQSDRTKAAGQSSVIGKLVKGAAAIGLAIAVAVGGMFALQQTRDAQPQPPVAPIEVPADLAPGTLPDSTGPPADGTNNGGQVDSPVRTPTLPESGQTGQPDQLERPVFTPFQLQGPDGAQINR